MNKWIIGLSLCMAMQLAAQLAAGLVTGDEKIGKVVINHIRHSQDSEVIRVFIWGNIGGTPQGGETYYRFQMCDSLYSSNCREVGRKEGYSLTDLNSRRARTRWNALAVNVLDVGLALGAPYAAASWFAAGALEAKVFFALAGAAAGEVASSALISAVDFLHPMKRWKEASAIAKKRLHMLQVADIYVTEPIAQFGLLLGEILEK